MSGAGWLYWDSLAEFLAMGGHALYVWGAYGFAAATLGLEAWLAWRRQRHALDNARAQPAACRDTESWR